MSAAHAQHVGPLLAPTGHAAHNLALRPRMALTLLRHASTARRAIRVQHLKAGWDHRYVFQVLAG